MNQRQNQSFASNRIKIRCPQCHTRLCDRVYREGTWLLHFRKGRCPEILTEKMFLTCSTCSTTHRITAEEGILESLRHPYASTGIQTETSGPANSSE